MKSSLLRFALAVILSTGTPLAASAKAGLTRKIQNDPRIEAAKKAIEAEINLGVTDQIFESAAFGWIENGAIVQEFYAGKANTRSIFDLASLTKPIFTASAIALLAEKGALSYDDLAMKHLTPWGQCKYPNGASCKWRKAIRIDDLLKHSSGLTDKDVGSKIVAAQEAGKDWREVVNTLAPEAARGRFRYQDVNYIVLAEIARIVLKKLEPETRIEDFVKNRIFTTLAMKSTYTHPIPKEVLGDVRPSSIEIPIGEVHDPIARSIPEIAGNAGLFSSLPDLMNFASMLLQKGKWEGQEIFTESTVHGFQTPSRGRGWDVSSPYAGPLRGRLGSGFGHSGYTGTSIWVVPEKDLALILLTNRTFYADGQMSWKKKGKSRIPDSRFNTKKRIMELREKIANFIAESRAGDGAKLGRAGQ